MSAAVYLLFPEADHAAFGEGASLPSGAPVPRVGDAVLLSRVESVERPDRGASDVEFEVADVLHRVQLRDDGGANMATYVALKRAPSKPRARS